MKHLIQSGEYEFGGLTVRVEEDPQSRLTCLTVATPGGQPARAYFNGLGEPVQPGQRDGLVEMLGAMNIPAAQLVPLAPDPDRPQE